MLTPAKNNEKRRDEVLRRMLKTPPKPHKDKPPRAVVKRRKTKPKG